MRYVNVYNFNDAVVQLKIFPKSLFAASYECDQTHPKECQSIKYVYKLVTFW
jgi:hypothetical protein